METILSDNSSSEPSLEALPSMLFKEAKKGYLYVLIDYNLIDTYKIGITTRSIQTRLKELNQSPGSAVKLWFLSPACINYRTVEKKLHKVFQSCNTYSGENNSLSEWFILPDKKLEELKLILKYEWGVTK